MREFNIFGPVYPQYHYHVNRTAVKAAMRQKIEKGRYFTLNAARQTGKTTLFQETLAELENTGTYFGILLDFELLTDVEKPRFYKHLGDALAEWREYHAPSAPDPAFIQDHIDFIAWLRKTGRELGKRGVLIIDEFDALSADILQPILSQFRGMYLKRHQPEYAALHSIILVGVRNIPSLLGGTQSPFNIADQFSIPYFTPDEVANLLTQHTQETGQIFKPQVIEEIIHETEGQPFLVNRLGQILIQDVVPDRSEPITPAAFAFALAKLLNENNTHFYSILSKATPHRAMLLSILLYNESRSDFLDPVTQELIMYGALRVVEDEYHLPYARVGNPIYRKMLLQRFAAPPEPLPINGSAANHLINGNLNFDGLLDDFKAFMEEHGVRLLRSKKTERPLEISGQYLLLSYLSAALNSVQGQVTIESLSSAGEIDILAFHRGRRFIVETKIWHSKQKFEDGKAQLVRYLKAAGLEKGYLVIFDEKLSANPLLPEMGELFEILVGEKTLRVYFVDVAV